MPDLTDFQATFQQMAPRSLEVRYDKIDVAKRTSRRVGNTLADLNRAARAWWRELHDAEHFVRRIVHIEPETNLIDIEPQRPVDIAP
jgi:hypothetical protein